VGSILRRNQDLLRNASSLAATTGVTSFLGFAYWVYAARVFSPEAVGYGSAAVSTLVLLGTIGMFGLDTMLIGELPRGGNRGGLIMACCVGAFGISLVLGLGWALVSLAFGTRFVVVNGSIERIAIFCLGVAVTGAAAVFDSATIGLMRGGIQLSRNVAMSVAKMAALPAVALVLHDVFGVGIMLAWVIGTAISMLPVAVIIKRGGGRILYQPDWETFWRLRRVALAHNGLNLAITIPTKLVPVLVAIVVLPSANGAFYVANMMYAFLMMVPTSLSTVLFAVASSATPEKIAEKLRFVLRMSLIIGIPSGLVMGLSSHWTLSVFGASYAKLAVIPLWILIVGYLPGLPNAVYIAVARVQGRFNQASIFLTVFAVLRMAALVVGGKLDGLYGLSLGMLAVQVTQAVITTPAVVKVAFGSVTVRSAADAADAADVGDAGDPAVRAAMLAEEQRRQQEAGIAALIAIATRVAPPLRQPGPAAGAAGPGWQPQPPAYPSRAAYPSRPAPQVTPQSQSQSQSRPAAVTGTGRHRRLATIAVTRGNPVLTDTSWWPDSDETAFRSRQEMAMETLIAIATQPASL
jgi:O-antigen/teichoic acid export membrane protein